MFYFKVNKIQLILSILWIAIFIVYVFIIGKITNRYHPLVSDELGYFSNSVSYLENNTLKAALTFNGKGSVVFGANAHGFAYPLLHGSLGKVFGWRDTNMIVFNFSLLFCMTLGIFFIKSLYIEVKFAISISMLSFPFTLLYSVTYMQEIIHTFFAFTLSIIVYFIGQEGRNKKIYVSVFLFVILLAGIFRSLWFVWLIGLLPFAENRRQVKNYIFLFIVGIFFGFLFLKFFLEPVPNKSALILSSFFGGDVTKGFSLLFSNVQHNFSSFFFDWSRPPHYIVLKFIPFLLTVFFLLQWYSTKRRLYASLALIGLVNYALLFTLYDAYYWREIRTMAPLFYFYIVFMVTCFTPKIRYLFLLIITLSFPLIIEMANGEVLKRNDLSQYSIDKKKAFEKIRDRVENNQIILLDYLPENCWDILYLPLQNRQNSPIRYIVGYYKVQRYPHRYVLCKPGKTMDALVLISNQYYTLYEKN